MPNALFQKRPLRDSVPEIAQTNIPKWLHIQLVFALVFDPILGPPPNLLFRETDPPKEDQRADRAKKASRNGPKMGPKKLRRHSIFALLVPPGAPEAS